MEVVDGIGERPAADRLARYCAAEGTSSLFARQAFLGNSPDVRTERVGSKEFYRRGRRFPSVRRRSFRRQEHFSWDSSAPSTSRHLRVFRTRILSKVMPFRTQRGSLTASRSKELTPQQPNPFFCAHDIGAVSDCRHPNTCRGLIKGPVVRLHLAIKGYLRTLLTRRIHLCLFALTAKSVTYVVKEINSQYTMHCAWCRTFLTIASTLRREWSTIPLLWASSY